MKNAKFGIFSEITLPPDQGTSSQAKRVNINGQKMTLARSALSTSLYLFDERKCLHLILAAPTFGYFHFGYLNKWRDLWVSSRLRGNKQKFFSTTILAAFGLICGNSRNNYNYPPIISGASISVINKSIFDWQPFSCRFIRTDQTRWVPIVFP